METKELKKLKTGDSLKVSDGKVGSFVREHENGSAVILFGDETDIVMREGVVRAEDLVKA